MVLPKGKAGSYGRPRAVAPQVMLAMIVMSAAYQHLDTWFRVLQGVGGLTPRQKDDRLMLQKAAERRRVREAGGSSGGCSRLVAAFGCGGRCCLHQRSPPVVRHATCSQAAAWPERDLFRHGWAQVGSSMLQEMVWRAS